MKKIWISNLLVASYVLISLSELKEGLILFVIAMFLVLSIVGEEVEKQNARRNN